MKKFLPLCLLLLCLIVFLPAAAEQETFESPVEVPVILKAYEAEPGQIYLEWSGSSSYYEVHVDGKNIKTVKATHHTFPLKSGTHEIQIFPVIRRESGHDTNVNLDVAGLVGFNVDLAMFGLTADDLTLGPASASVMLDYLPDTIFTSAAAHLSAKTDYTGCVVLSFEAPLPADEYQVKIQQGKDISYIRFSVDSADTASLITQSQSSVSIRLDPAFLKSGRCMVPEIGTKYKFSVLLRRYAENYLSGGVLPSVIHESKESKALSYKPVESWKQAPVITYASQTADGKITLRWEHDSCGADCSYVIYRVKKLGGLISQGKEKLARTKNHAYVLTDLEEGRYYIRVVPEYGGLEGEASKDANLLISNQWQNAPEIISRQTTPTDVLLSWICPEGIDRYHLTVQIPRHSLAGFINLSYETFFETDIDAVPGPMEYTYTYNNPYDKSKSPTLRIQLYGIRLTGEEEQYTDTAQSTVRLN